MAKSHTHTELVGKFVQYHKPNYRWQFGKVKEVVLYARGPNKGQLRYARIATSVPAYNRDGSPKWDKDGLRVHRWTGPCRRTTKIFRVLKGKNTWIKFKEWLK